jgi:hypothetical protein
MSDSEALRRGAAPPPRPDEDHESGMLVAPPAPAPLPAPAGQPPPPGPGGSGAGPTAATSPAGAGPTAPTSPAGAGPTAPTSSAGAGPTAPGAPPVAAPEAGGPGGPTAVGLAPKPSIAVRAAVFGGVAAAAVAGVVAVKAFTGRCIRHHHVRGLPRGIAHGHCRLNERRGRVQRGQQPAHAGPSVLLIVVEQGSQTFPIGALEPGQSDSVTFACTNGSIGARADAKSQVTESNEKDNTRTAGPFSCAAPTSPPSTEERGQSALAETGVPLAAPGWSCSGVRLPNPRPDRPNAAARRMASHSPPSA